MMATTKKNTRALARSASVTKADLQAKLNQVQQQTGLLLQMNNTLVRRAQIAAGLGKQFGGDRDLYEAFGYPKNPGYEDYLNIYERDGLGTRIVDAVSDETWRERPVLVEGENVKLDELDDPGPLQKAFAELDDQFHLLSAFNEVDAACGISRFGLIFLGLPGQLDAESKGKQKLMYINVYDEGNAQIDETSIVRDPASPRFGLPERYQIAVDDRTKSYKNVHWSRVIHVKEGTDKRSYRRVYGNARLKNMINRLWDLEKVVGSGSEAFWLLIRKGLAITAKEGMTLPSAGTPEYNDLVDEIEEYEHGLSRIMKLMGMDVKDLGSEPVSSRDQFDVVTDYLAGTSHIPKRILLGSERGELASSQDEFNFGAFIKSRQSKFAEPFILRPAIDRLGELGVLKVPPKYTVIWESLFQLTDMDKSTIASNVATAISTVSGGTPETVMPPDVFAQRYLDYKPSPEDVAKIEESKTKADEANRKTPPSPTDGGDPFESLLNPSDGKGEPDKAQLNRIMSRVLYGPDHFRGQVHLNEGTPDSWRSEPFVMVVGQDGANGNSAMVAFKIPEVLKVDLVTDYPWMPQDIVDEMHITLCYLGDIRTLPREKIEQAVGAFAMAAQPLKVEMQGIGRFVSGMDSDPVVATFDSPGDELGELRQTLVEILDASGIPYHDNHGFIPHMTMSYIAPNEELPTQTVKKLEMNFDSVHLVVGGEWKEYKFGELPEQSIKNISSGTDYRI
jgi:2'-5' RNA ligase